MTSKIIRRVGFVDWDSDEERKRHEKGVALRKKWKEEKMANHLHDNRICQQVWNALIDANLSDQIKIYARDDYNGRHQFKNNFKQFFRQIRRNPNFRNRIDDENRHHRELSTRYMLHELRESGITFAEIQQANNDQQYNFLDGLRVIGAVRSFYINFASSAHISSGSSGEEENHDEQAERGGEDGRGDGDNGEGGGIEGDDRRRRLFRRRRLDNDDAPAPRPARRQRRH